MVNITKERQPEIYYCVWR